MSNTLYIPESNPLHFVPVTPNISPAYNTKFYDDYLFADTIRDFEEQEPFYQPWQKNDTIFLQFQANFSPIQLDVQDCNLNTLLSLTCTQVRANKYLPGWFVYQAALSLSSLPDQKVRVLLTPGEDPTAAQKSEWIELSTIIVNTVFCEYFNSRFHGDVVYETGIKFGLRIPGFLNKTAPGSEDQLYKDQVLNQTLLSGKPFKNWKLFVGDGSGVPEWMIEKVNVAFCCNNVKIDGRLFAKLDGTKWTEFTEDKKRLTGYSIELLPGLNRSSKIVNTSVDPNIKMIIQYNLDAGIWGDTSANAGENTTAMLSYE